MVASGRVPETPLAAVQAYLDHANFGTLPRAGGTFDQPGDLMAEMRVVASAVNRARKRRSDRERAEAARVARSAGRRR